MKGQMWRIQSRTGLDGLAPDTTYRTVTMYAPLTVLRKKSEKEAMLYNTQTGYFSCSLSPNAKFKEIKTDPVAIQSIWRGGELPEPDFTSQSQRPETRLSLY